MPESFKKPRFANCYVGIPLPVHYDSEYRVLQSQVWEVNPNFRRANPGPPRLPHIGLFYLQDLTLIGKLAVDRAIAQCVDQVPLIGTRLVVGGMDLFRDRRDQRNNRFRSLVMEVHSTQSSDDPLANFHCCLGERLRLYLRVTHPNDFRPHLTVAFIPVDKLAQQSVVETQDQLSRLMVPNWEFVVSQIVLVGKDIERAVIRPRVLTTFRPYVLAKPRADRIVYQAG